LNDFCNHEWFWDLEVNEEIDISLEKARHWL